MMSKHQPLVGVIFLLLSLSAAAQPVEVINLHNRPADEMIPIIRPFLKPGDSLTGTGYQLIIRTDPQNLEAIKSFVTGLDKAPAQLLISVKNTGESDQVDSSLKAGGTIVGDNRRIIVNDSGASEGIHIEAHRRETAAGRQQSPQIRVTEGRAVLIYTGVSVPVKIRQQLRQGNRIVEQERVEYRNVESGLYVTARLNQNDEVILAIEPHQQSLGDSGAVNTFGLSTTIQGKLGEWIPLGEVTASGMTSSTRPGAATNTRTQSRNSVMLKVERIED